MSVISKKYLCSLFLFFSFSLVTLAAPALYAMPVEQLVFSRDKSQLVYVLDNEIIKRSIATGKILNKTPFTLANNATLFAPTVDGFKLLAAHTKGIDVIHKI